MWTSKHFARSGSQRVRPQQVRQRARTSSFPCYRTLQQDVQRGHGVVNSESCTLSRKGTPSHRALLMNIAIALKVGHRLRSKGQGHIDATLILNWVNLQCRLAFNAGGCAVHRR